MLRYYKINIYQTLNILIYCFLIIIFACANQQPPGGGEEDKTPPKVKLTYPKEESVNFKGNKIRFSFNEYVDKRSFQDAFKIFPSPKGEISFEWGGKEVDVKFEKKLNEQGDLKTYVVIINSTLTDLHGNKLDAPFSFAFSTGSYIDSASVSGNVFNTDKVVSVAAYKLSDTSKEFDPSTNQADYITETSVTGRYSFTNLSKGLYRIITFDDEDKNLLYTAGRENYGVLKSDILLSDTSNLTNFNFFMYSRDRETGLKKEYNYKDYYKDSFNIIYSSINDGYKNFLPEQSIFLFFNKYKPSREALSGNIYLKDEKDNPVKFVINWINDSLIEAFASAGFEISKAYKLEMKIKTSNDSIYNYNLTFKTASQNSFGEIYSRIIKPIYQDTGIVIPVVVRITAKDAKPEIQYLFHSADTSITMQKILEGEYTIFAFLDLNGNEEYDYGEAYPFRFSEPFFVYPSIVRIRGGWLIDNLVIDFTK
jgi:uncharacterized protein (DUF2141 family)